MVSLGYRSVETLGRVGEHKHEARIEKVRVSVPTTTRSVEMRSMGCHLSGVCLPHVDAADPITLIDGVHGRMGKVMPEVDRLTESEVASINSTIGESPLPVKRNNRIIKLMQGPGRTANIPASSSITSDNFYVQLARTTQSWVNANLRPLPPDVDYSFETWLDQTNYEEWRKVELRRIYDEVINPLEFDGDAFKHFKVKLFCKDETYVSFKHARGIYAREDVAKCFFGPWFKLMESSLYEHPAFIKHVPVKDRAKYIDNMLRYDGARYVQTDYSSYEAHFTPILMESCEFTMYEHMMKKCEAGKLALDVMRFVLQGENVVQNKFFHGIVEACRMSGEMNTSLGNGFSNLMLMNFQCVKLGVPCIGVVEGDDGLFTFLDSSPKESDFTRCGCIIKLVEFSRISDASFCGLLYDESDLQIVTDPREVLATFGWTTKQYARAKTNTLKSLLRCKALSYIVQYPGCPIIASLARYGLRVTKSHDVRKYIGRKGICMWEREQLIYGLNNFKHCLDEEILIGTRFLVEENYGIDVPTQIRIEQYLDGLDVLQPLDVNVMYDLFPSDWKSYWNDYVIKLGRSEEAAKVDCLHREVPSED